MFSSQRMSQSSVHDVIAYAPRKLRYGLSPAMQVSMQHPFLRFSPSTRSRFTYILFQASNPCLCPCVGYDKRRGSECLCIQPMYIMRVLPEVGYVMRYMVT